MIWQVLKNSLADVWDEMLYVVLFNIIWLLGTLLIIPWPAVTFGLAHIVYDIGQSKGIKFGKFWQYIRQTWKQAYIWGGINLVVLLTVWLNLNFYATIETDWAGYLQILFIGLTGFWLIWQLITLVFYPRLRTPNFALALRNAAIVMGKYPLLTIAFIGMVLLVMAIAVFFQILMAIGAISVVFIMANRVVDAVVKKEKGPEPLEDESFQL
jgi:hypothetical protein